MKDIQKIKDYVEKAEIKKTLFGGYNKADVHRVLNSVLEMFETTLKEQKEKEEKRAAELLKEMDMIREDAEAKVEVADALNVELNKTIAVLTDDIEKAEALNVELNKTIASLTDNIEKADALIAEQNKTIVFLKDDLDKVEEKMGNVQKGLSDLLDMFHE